VLESEARNNALDRLQDMVEQSDAFTGLVSERLDDLREKFDDVSFGHLIKTTTGWPRVWLMKELASKRAEFFKAVRFFSGIDRGDWERLLTPLVNGIRVASFQASLVEWQRAAVSRRLYLRS
jgi:hypothetical protein